MEAISYYLLQTTMMTWKIVIRGLSIFAFILFLTFKKVACIPSIVYWVVYTLALFYTACYCPYSPCALQITILYIHISVANNVSDNIKVPELHQLHGFINK